MISSDAEFTDELKTRLIIKVANTFGAFKSGEGEEAEVYDSDDKFKNGPI